MKQIIVMIATIILGLAIAGIIMSFEDTADAIGNGSKEKIESVFSGKGIEV